MARRYILLLSSHTYRKSSSSPTIKKNHNISYQYFVSYIFWPLLAFPSSLHFLHHISCFLTTSKKCSESPALEFPAGHLFPYSPAILSPFSFMNPPSPFRQTSCFFRYQFFLFKVISSSQIQLSKFLIAYVI